MNNKSCVTVTYTVKAKDGYAVDKQRQFTTANAAYVFIKTLKQQVLVIGTPCIETSRWS